MALTPSRRRVATAGALSLAALVCSSRAASPATTAAESPLADQLTELSAPLDCATAYPLYDDVYHDASMRGLICVDGEGTISQLRVYDSPFSATVALQDWSIDPASQWLLHDANWFAIGPRAQIDVLTAHSDADARPTQELPTLPPDYSPNPLDDCAQFVSSTANTYLTDPSQFSTDQAALDQVLPGVTTEIESLLQQPDVAPLRSLSPDAPSFESELSRLGPALKTFCRNSQATAPE